MHVFPISYSILAFFALLTLALYHMHTARVFLLFLVLSFSTILVILILHVDILQMVWEQYWPMGNSVLSINVLLLCLLYLKIVFWPEANIFLEFSTFGLICLQNLTAHVIRYGTLQLDDEFKQNTEASYAFQHHKKKN